MSFQETNAGEGSESAGIIPREEIVIVAITANTCAVEVDLLIGGDHQQASDGELAESNLTGTPPRRRSVTYFPSSDSCSGSPYGNSPI